MVVEVVEGTQLRFVGINKKGPKHCADNIRLRQNWENRGANKEHFDWACVELRKGMNLYVAPSKLKRESLWQLKTISFQRPNTPWYEVATSDTITFTRRIICVANLTESISGLMNDFITDLHQDVITDKDGDMVQALLMILTHWGTRIDVIGDGGRRETSGST